MSTTNDLRRIDPPTTDVVDVIGEWYLMDGTTVECIDLTDDERAVLADDWGATYTVPTSHLDQEIPRVRCRNDPRPPSSPVK